MRIKFQCAKCETRLEIDAESAGAAIVCPNCGFPQVVPRKKIGPGTILGGFEIVRLIGRGGMGEVYLARQRSLDRMVALKVLARELAPSEDAVQRFIQEIRLTAQLEHPYLVTAYEGGEDAGVLYLAMAYIRGSSLHERVRVRGPLGEADALMIGRKVATALNYAWEELRLLHRDIKPSNILIDVHGEPRLADLGLAKCLGQREGQTLVGAVLGTPNYMSPEQAEGREDLDVRSDMYSLGATLYTAVTGQIPYQARTLYEVLRRQATEPLPDPRTYAPHLSEEFVELLGLLLARDRRQRPPDWPTAIAEFDRRLVRHQGPAAILPMAESSISSVPTRRAWWRSPVGWVLSTAVALAVGVVSGWIWWTYWRPLPRRGEAPAAGGPRDQLTNLVRRSEKVVTPTPSTSLWAHVPDDRRFQPASHPPLPPERRRQAVRLWMELRDYMRLHPEDVEGQFHRFEQLMALVQDAPLAKDLEEWAKSIRLRERVRERELERAQANIRQRVEELLAAGQFDAARQVLQNSTAAWADELRDLREELLARVQAREAQERRAEAERQAGNAIAEAARCAVRLQWAQARAALTKPSASIPEDIAVRYSSARALVEVAAAWPLLVVTNLSACRGQKLPLEFRDGRSEVFQIAGASEGKICVRRMLPEGFVEILLSPHELAATTRERYVGTTDPSVIAFLRGVWHLETGAMEAAAAAFETSGTELGKAMASLLRSHG